MNQIMTTPKPGSDEARAQGCKCPRIDNHYGLGKAGRGNIYGWFLSGECELHRMPALDALLKAVGR